MCVCAHVRVFVHACVFSVLVHQHLRPLIMTVMICQQMTYAPKKTFSFQLQLLFAMAVPSCFPPPPDFKFLLLSLHPKLYLLINVFPLILALLGSLLQHTASLLASVCCRGATEGLSLFDLGCPLLPPPALGPTGGLWRHLGPLGGIIKPLSGPLSSVREAKRSTGHSVYPCLYFRSTPLALMPTYS